MHWFVFSVSSAIVFASWRAVSQQLGPQIFEKLERKGREEARKREREGEPEVGAGGGGRS